MRGRFKYFLLLSFAVCYSFQCQNNNNTSAAPVAKSAFVGHSDSLKVVYSNLFYKLDTFFKNKYRLGGFNGAVIVAKGDRIYYQTALGYENYQTKDTLTTASSFQIASVSKTFTATAILYLVEHGKLKIDDTIGTFIPNFPYRNIRIKDLLSHRSGLPNYLHFGEVLWKDKSLYMTNDALIELLKKFPRMEGSYLPNKRFEYCNTNYAVLATIVEKVSGKRFPAFMKETFFDPLGMTNSWINDVTDTTRKKIAISYNSRWIPQKDDPYDGVYGDKGVYSSTSDMLKWNLAFYQGKLISNELQKEAYSPRSFERPGVRNYGYGWRLMKQPNNEYLVYHNGWWHGNNTVFYRYVPDTFALIILSNRYNRGVYNVQPIFDLINGTSSAGGNMNGEE